MRHFQDLETLLLGLLVVRKQIVVVLFPSGLLLSDLLPSLFADYLSLSSLLYTLGELCLDSFKHFRAAQGTLLKL